MRSTLAMLFRFAIAIAAAMLSAELVARALGASFATSIVAAGAIILVGYLSGVLYLLRHRALMGRWTRVRLLISLLTPAAVGVIALAQPLGEIALGLILLVATMTAFPLLWLGCYDVSRGLRGLPPGTWRFFQDDFNPCFPGSIGWILCMAFLVLVVLEPFMPLGRTALTVASILAINGGTEVLVAVGAFLSFTLGFSGETGGTLIDWQASSRSADDEWPWDSTGIFDRDEDSSSMFTETRNFNPSTGLEMVGAFDSGGYGFGQSTSDQDSFDSFSSHDSGISGSSWHDS